jgi:hypothetical protein
MIHGFVKRAAIAGAMCLGMGAALQPGAALAIPTVTIHPSNVGIGAINVSVVGAVITIEEFWTSASPGFLLIDGLDQDVAYTVRKIIHNNSGIAWTRLANELLDPAGQTNDDLDPKPYPAFVPAGFTTSNDQDGPIFDQFGSQPRTSTVFQSVFVDEDTDVRDFLDFFNGTLNNGAIDTLMTYGLIDKDTTQPFLLSQRPNAFSRVAEGGILLIMGAGLAGIAWGWRRHRRA